MKPRQKIWDNEPTPNRLLDCARHIPKEYPLRIAISTLAHQSLRFNMPFTSVYADREVLDRTLNMKAVCVRLGRGLE
jgi:hypothetical protein